MTKPNDCLIFRESFARFSYVHRVAAMLEIEALLERKPRQLSGGERLQALLPSIWARCVFA